MMTENKVKQNYNLCIEESTTAIDAMQRMNDVSPKVLFVVRDNRLVAALTDGDIRRHILSNGDLRAEVRNIANYRPMYLNRDSRQFARRFMREKSINAVPIVDDEMRIIDVIAWHEDSWKATGRTIHCPVIMMAGGRGSRLYPYTKVLPKPLIPIGKIPISEHIINQFYRQGCEEFYLIVNYKGNMIKAYYSEMKKPYCITFVDEDKPLGTGGGLSLMKGMVRETCILTNCDILIRESFANIMQYHKEQCNKITMICSAKSFPIPYGVVHIKENGCIDYMEEKPELSFLTNTGCYVLEPDVIDKMEDDIAISFPDIVNRYKDAGENVGVYPISENVWHDMGQMDEMERMRMQLEEGIE